MTPVFRLALAAAVTLLTFAGPAAAQTLPPAGSGIPFRDCPECPEMVVLPKGAFVMGGDVTEEEQPKHPVFMKKAFAFSRFEITFDEWEACLRANACTHNPHDHNWGRGRQPVVNVDYFMVEGFAKWLSQKTGRRYRIPSEAEWEYAARAGTTTNYWFGDDPGKEDLNCRKCKGAWPDHRNAPVGQYKPNPWGVYDMHGNAYEWTADCWTPDYTGAPRDGAVRRDGDCNLRVIRGGSWYYFSRQSRSASRAKNPPAVKSYWLSFRVVREID